MRKKGLPDGFLKEPRRKEKRGSGKTGKIKKPGALGREVKKLCTVVPRPHQGVVLGRKPPPTCWGKKSLGETIEPPEPWDKRFFF